MILRRGQGGYRMFWCPGCDSPHALTVEGPHAWGFNGDEQRPTFTPSVLVTGGGDKRRCHSFVRDGQIQFLGDCTHALANQTVPLPEWPADFHVQEPSE